MTPIDLITLLSQTATFLHSPAGPHAATALIALAALLRAPVPLCLALTFALHATLWLL
ncbi:hypothetical protein [uncultured Sulfitobacter sp.]|uniref:hypothetical protein n=1 Tax=uncultured Sulfitobacter sp. TaxID=191468 RepID=UPI00261814DC|nr:hypothetical protein [uncultured Sulfitobacter sp.]